MISPPPASRPPMPGISEDEQEKLRTLAEAEDVDSFVFTWFNSIHPNAMHECLAQYDDLRAARAGGEG